MNKKLFIYFVKPVGMDGPIKIGCSSEPERRLKALATWSPFPLELIGCVEGGFSSETVLHKTFSHLHSHREWFLTSSDLRLAVERILGGESIRSVCEERPQGPRVKNKYKQVVTPDRRLFREYRRRIKSAMTADHHGAWHAPFDVQMIMRRWAKSPTTGQSVTPSGEEMSRLEEFLAAPNLHSVFLGWGYSPVPYDDRLRNPDIHPSVADHAA